MSTIRKALCVLAALILSVTAVPAARAGGVVMTWVPSFEACELVPEALCLQTSDGSTLQVLDPRVSLGGSDCLDLPKTHGDYVRVFDNLAPEAVEPALTLQMRTGSCAHGAVDQFDTAFVDADTHLTDPIDASAQLKPASFNGDATFFDPGLGACGQTNSASDFIFALPASMFDPVTPNGNPNRNSLCGRRVSVSGPDGTVTATLTDRKPEKFGDIDLSPAAFNQIASPDEGRVKVTWKFIS